MSTHKHIDKLCLIGVILALLLMLVLMNGEALGIQAADRLIGYEERLFDASTVHSIEIIMDDLSSFIETCENEEYAACSVVIDGETYKNVGIRAKGNTSLSTVSSMNSDRYSFKIEFDQYDSTKTYHGLDKLSLNNLIQDNTMMKDYLTYQMMGQFGAVAPLCSYVYITVNGEDWGLYLAVEGVEEGFLQRNYGSDYGELYKPDSMDMGGGRGNGRDFNMEDFTNTQRETASSESSTQTAPNTPPELPDGGMPESFAPSSFSGGASFEGIDPSTMGSGSVEWAEDFDPSAIFGEGGWGNTSGGWGGMGSSDAKLQYIDDDPDSYSTIFDSAKTEVTETDKSRLIQSLKLLSEGKQIEDVVAVEEVIRYFVVHNFVVNGDSYTGSMIHNYYLYEENGQLSLLPWDYNLAFGSFQAANATDAVNDPIDTPLSVTGSGDRPMIDWIFSNAEYTQLYHQYFAEFLAGTDFATLINQTAELIAPYVETDPSKFCTYTEFEAGIAALREFCLLRAESVQGQLDEIIPATAEGQQADSSTRIDASHITLSNMGTMSFGGRENPGNMRTPGNFQGGDFPARNGTGNSGGTRGQMPQSAEGTPSAGSAAQSFDPTAQDKATEITPTAQTGTSTTDQSVSPYQPSDNTGDTDTADGQFQFPEGMQPFANTDQQFSQNNGREFTNGSIPNGISQSSTQNTPWLLLGISALVLLIGLLIAFRYKH